MRPTLSFHEVAEAELNEAADFYDLESPGLGTVFIDKIQTTTDRGHSQRNCVGTRRASTSGERKLPVGRRCHSCRAA